MEQEQFDILIVGGGLVGCCLAYALKDMPLRIGIIEARSPAMINASTDNRAIALTYGSQYYLNKLGLWPNFMAEAMPIQQVHISNRGHFGMTRFSAQDYAISALGYVLPFNHLQQGLQQAIAGVSAIPMLAPAQVLAMTKVDQHWQLTLQTPQGQQFVTAALVIAADGGNSTVRQLQNTPVTEWAYQQTAIIAHVTLQRSHQHIAYERFIPYGAIALLPYNKQQVALIWTVKNAYLNDLLQLDDSAFIARLQQEFGYRAGRFLHISPRQSYPLKMIYAQANTDVVLLGNAAHTLHPIAAQGFNLGLRDVEVLAQLLQKHTQQSLLNSGQILNNAFLKQRHTDHQRMIYLTDSLTRIFAHDFLPLVIARNIGLTSFEFLPGLKRKFTAMALGLLR